VAAIVCVHLGLPYRAPNWADDYVQYIQQAINIANGVDMADTGYIYSRYSPRVGPRAYPPGFPLLLVPTYLIFGPDLRAFQAEMTVLHLLMLVAVYWLYRRDVAPLTALVLLLMLGLSPYGLAFTAEVRSDLPYVLASTLFLLSVERGVARQRAATILVAALVGAAACLIRTVGYLALAAVVMSACSRRRSTMRFSLPAVGLALLPVAVSRLVLGGGDESYVDPFSGFTSWTIAHNLRTLALSLNAFWAGPSLALGEWRLPILALLSLPCVLAGWMERWRRSSLLIEWFVLLNLGAVLVWPVFEEPRFVYPVFPLLLLYAGIGFESLVRRVEQRSTAGVRRALVAVTAGLVLLVYAVRTGKMIATARPVSDGPFAPAATALFGFVRNQTPVDAVFLFRRPRALAYFTGRRASAFPDHEPPAVSAAYAQEIGADYLIAARNDPDASHTLVTACSTAFVRLYASDTFVVYRIDRGALAACKVNDA
jgi:hypothetical protein